MKIIDKNILSSVSPSSLIGLFLPLLCLICTGCFTGIEGTKKINLSREDKKLSNPTPEERFMEQIVSMPLIDWEEGKVFIASDDKALLVIVPQEGLLPIAPDSVKGKELFFQGVESKINAAGNLTVSILFSDGVYLYAFDTGKEFDAAMSEIKSDQIPMMIDMDMVDQARALLTGQKLWTRSNLWYDEKGNRIEGKKFVEVKVVDVQPGDMVFPLWIEFSTEDGNNAYAFMNFGSSDTESRSFHNLFSLSDIRKHYPGIDKETWDCISRGKVKFGMTKEECKLALGNPGDIRSGHDYSQTLDIWNYDNGIVLWFEDGKLTKIRE